MVDVGDADIIHADQEPSLANIEAGARAILAAGALPVVLGGDHSVNDACISAFDAHLDYVDGVSRATSAWQPNEALPRTFTCIGLAIARHSK
jgi:arginase family enzyme